MTKQDMISRIIQLEFEMTSRVINDKEFRPHNEDEYKEYRKEVSELRKKVKKLIIPPNSLINKKQWEK